MTLKEKLQKAIEHSDKDAIKKYVKGKKFKIINTRSSHNYGKVGNIIEVESLYDWNGEGAVKLTLKREGTENWTGNWIEMSRLEVIGNSVEQLLAEEKELTEQLKQVQSKLAYLTKTGETEFDEIVYKTYRAVEELEEGSGSRIELAKAIAKIIKE